MSGGYSAACLIRKNYKSEKVSLLLFPCVWVNCLPKISCIAASVAIRLCTHEGKPAFVSLHCIYFQASPAVYEGKIAFAENRSPSAAIFTGCPYQQRQSANTKPILNETINSP
jgi:hypothetical protein